MPSEEKKQSYLAPLAGCRKSAKGGALIETTAGILIILPVFLLLIDIIALVIAQSINDDLAKQAARYAAQQANQTAAQTVANDYLNLQTSYTGNSGLICQASVLSCNFDANNGVQVTTQIRCNLPVPVPFGGPSYTIFRAQFTEAAVGVAPTIP